VTIITEDIIAPVELVDWLIESSPPIDYIVVSNIALSMFDKSREVTYGFKNECDAITFKLKFSTKV